MSVADVNPTGARERRRQHRTGTSWRVQNRDGSATVRALVVLRDRGVLVLWLLMVAVFSYVARPYFFTFDNASLIANAAAVTAVFAAAVAFGILSGALDLSIPGTAALAGVVVAKALAGGIPVWASLVLGVAVGAAVGVVNAELVRRGLNPLVVTIAMLTALQGLANILASGVAIAGVTQLTWLGTETYWRLPAPVYVAAILYVLGWVFLTRVRAGRRLTAVGSNADAVRRVGIPADRYRMLGFVLSGCCAAIGGIVITATTTQGSPTPSVDQLFTALTAVALSGMPLSGGRGSLPRVLVGTLIIATISSALVIRGVEPYYATLVTGILLVAALVFERLMSAAVARRLTPPAEPVTEPVAKPAGMASPTTKELA